MNSAILLCWDLIIPGLYQEQWKSFNFMYAFIKPTFNEYLLGVKFWATKRSRSLPSTHKRGKASAMETILAGVMGAGMGVQV